jgi:hypothetical protein
MALANNAELVIDDVSGFSYDHAYQRRYQLDRFNIPCRKATPEERLEPFSRIRRYLKRAHNKCRSFEDRNYIQQEGITFDPRLLHVNVSGTVYLEGYWPSENYFKDVEHLIRRDLQIAAPADAVNLVFASQIQERNSVAVHVRYFDNPAGKRGNSTLGDYYARAIAQMEQFAPGAHYFVFSDQPDCARGWLPISNDRTTFVNENKGDENAYADLWLMTKARHFIIANSTFSWWGAWLSDNSSKIVIAPKVEPNRPNDSWGFDGLIPPQWHQC